MQYLDGLVTIASATVTRSYAATFGNGDSQLASLQKLWWDPINGAFVKGYKRELLMGTWSLTKHPCYPPLAQAILELCAEEEVRNRFFAHSLADTDDTALFMCTSHLVSLHRRRALKGRLEYVRLASFSFQFYAPDGTVQTVNLEPELTRSFFEKMKRVERETA